MHFLERGGGGGGGGGRHWRTGGLVRTLQQIRPLEVVKTWGLRFMMTQLLTLVKNVGTLLLVKKEEIGNKLYFQPIDGINMTDEINQRVCEQLKFSQECLVSRINLFRSSNELR